MQWFIEAIYTLCKAYTDEQILNGKNMPAGAIILWYGERDDIPDGWQACGGGEGSPDLRGYFVRGAGGEHVVGDTGGTTIHRHTTAGDHTHPIGSGSYIQSGTGYHNYTDSPKKSETTDFAGTLPPYHNLWYIMKL